MAKINSTFSVEVIREIIDRPFPSGKRAGMSPVESEIIRRKLAVVVENLKKFFVIKKIEA